MYTEGVLSDDSDCIRPIPGDLSLSNAFKDSVCCSLSLVCDYTGSTRNGMRAKYSGGLSFCLTAGKCLLKQIMLGVDGLYLETTPVGGGPSKQTSPDDLPRKNIGKLGTLHCLESDGVLKPNDLLLLQH